MTVTEGAVGYRTHVFDLDGVVFRSNGAKESAFYRAALLYGPGRADALVSIHRRAGGVSRREQVEQFVDGVLTERSPEEVEDILERIAEDLDGAYDEVPFVLGVRPYLAYLAHLQAQGVAVALVSGVEEIELEEILQRRELRGSFGLVSGGPPSKAERLLSLVESGAIELPAVYYGDTEDDYRAADAAGLRFVLITADARWPYEEWQPAVQPADLPARVVDFWGLLDGLSLDEWRAIAQRLGVQVAANAGVKGFRKAVMAAEQALTPALSRNRERGSEAEAEAEAVGGMDPEALTPALSRNRERGSEAEAESGKVVQVRVDGKGFAMLDGERRFLGRSLAGALVTVDRRRHPAGAAR